jgi:6-pyruvoyltetrahydropterin/6-carboxytetrahydropterin synthase
MIPVQTIAVKHNIEVAHRLFETPGKCENIHGHSMWVTLEVTGPIDSGGMLLGIDFGALKKQFRSYLDASFDHHLLLCQDDPWAQDLDPNQEYDGSLQPKLLPGLTTLSANPTTENLARVIGEYMHGIVMSAFQTVGLEKVSCTVWETSVNCATWSITLEQ